jgi:hypothetical protein
MTHASSLGYSGAPISSDGSRTGGGERIDVVEEPKPSGTITIM